jgi:ATP-dependent DNA helicase RecQ
MNQHASAIEIARKHFPQVKDFWDIQEESIHDLGLGQSLLCLAPTGGGKSLIYQVAGLQSGKMTIVISPLVALMDQQATRLQASGLSAVALHAGLAGLPYYRAVRSLFNGAPPHFLFVSPERLRFDGYLNYVLRRNRDRIGLLVVDEAHCISQWGEAFRPAYRSIPAFIRSVFGSQNAVPLLGLTATLNRDDQQQICVDFNLSPNSIKQSSFLLRKNLNLSFETLVNEKAKLARLEALLEKRRGEKMIVYVHRISSAYGTRAMAERFNCPELVCRSFDAEMGSAEKRDVLLGFESGSIPVVFATAAFGMGIDIPDIRGVIHYLAPESLEQYYQEVGRAGRDGKPAFGHLLFSETNIRVRRDLLKRSFPRADEIREFYEKKILRGKHATGYIQINPWLELNEESREGLMLQILEDARVLKLATLGVSAVDCFQAAGPIDERFSVYASVSPIGAILDVVKRTGIPVSQILEDLYTWLDQEKLRLVSVPSKVALYELTRELDEELLGTISDDLEAKKRKRLENFERLVEAIGSDQPPERLLAAHLGIEFA